MSLEAIIEKFGYWAIFLGTALEGETILVIAGYLAHRGYLRLPYVIIAALLGTLVGDQTFFQIGRQSGEAFLARHPNWQVRAVHVQRLFNRHRIALVMGFRFMYGIRTVSPFVIGMCGFSRKWFLLLNAVSATIWAITIGCAGYVFGRVLETFLNEAKRIELPVILCIVGIGLMFWIWHSRHVRCNLRHNSELKKGRDSRAQLPGSHT
jgi:membrane protein DedA with SNARE-associated domain